MTIRKPVYGIRDELDRLGGRVGALEEAVGACPRTAAERARAAEERRRAEWLDEHPEEDPLYSYERCVHAAACSRVARMAMAYADGWDDAEMAARLCCQGCQEWW